MAEIFNKPFLIQPKTQIKELIHALYTIYCRLKHKFLFKNWTKEQIYVVLHYTNSEDQTKSKVCLMSPPCVWFSLRISKCYFNFSFLFKKKKKTWWKNYKKFIFFFWNAHPQSKNTFLLLKSCYPYFLLHALLNISMIAPFEKYKIKSANCIGFWNYQETWNKPLILFWPNINNLLT